MAVKGTTQPLLVVVPYRPVRRIMPSLSWMVMVSARAAGSYYWGVNQGAARQADAVAERNELRQLVAVPTEESKTLQQEVVNLKLGAQVDHEANEQVRAQVITLKEEITALQEEISFYRGIMAPENSNRGLVMGSLNVISTGLQIGRASWRDRQE